MNTQELLEIFIVIKQSVHDNFLGLNLLACGLLKTTSRLRSACATLQKLFSNIHRVFFIKYYLKFQGRAGSRLVLTTSENVRKSAGLHIVSRFSTTTNKCGLLLTIVTIATTMTIRKCGIY